MGERTYIYELEIDRINYREPKLGLKVRKFVVLKDTPKQIQYGSEEDVGKNSRYHRKINKSELGVINTRYRYSTWASDLSEKTLSAFVAGVMELEDTKINKMTIELCDERAKRASLDSILEFIKAGDDFIVN